MYVNRRFKITSYSMIIPSSDVTWMCEHIIDFEAPICDGIYEIRMSRNDVDLILICESRNAGIKYIEGTLKKKTIVAIHVPYEKINTMMASGLTYGITGKCDIMRVGMTGDGLKFIHHNSRSEITVQNTSNRAFKKIVLACAKITRNSSARERLHLQDVEIEFAAAGGQITGNIADFLNR